MSQKIIGKKLVNRFCPIKKVLLGDTDLVRNLKGRVSKANFVSVGNDEATKTERTNSFRKPFKKRYNLNVADVISKDPKPKVEEKIERANFTGLADEEIFGPAFLYEDPEICTAKKSLPTNTNQKNMNILLEAPEDHPLASILGVIENSMMMKSANVIVMISQHITLVTS